MQIHTTSDYINKGFEEKDGCGAFARPTFRSSSGVDWHETLVKCARQQLGSAAGTVKGVTIPAQFNGSEIRRITAYAGAIVLASGAMRGTGKAAFSPCRSLTWVQMCQIIYNVDQVLNKSVARAAKWLQEKVQRREFLALFFSFSPKR